MSGLSGMVFGATKGRVLKTGQTTQYSSEADDGLNQKGLTKAYSVLSTGGYSGTTNIDLAHYTGGAGAIAFVAATKKITDTGNGLAIVKTGDTIICTGPTDPANIVVLTVATGNVAGEIVVNEVIADETPAGVVTISKREAHSNNCVLDLNTGLMWSRYISDKMGTASDGKMVWTGQLYDIFQYAAAANTASLGGYTDWRVPNRKEIESLINDENAASIPDTTTFAGYTAGTLWTSTTIKSTTTEAFVFEYDGSLAVGRAKASFATQILLVRGG